MKRETVFVLVLVALAASVYAQQFKFTSIDFPGAIVTAARGINNHGDIAGSYRIPGSPRQAMLLKKGKFIPLAPPAPDASFSEATSINDRGDVTGQWGDANGFFHGFLLSDGVLTILDVPGATDTFALGVNDSGLVAGYWDLLDPNGNTLAVYGFTWKDGGFVDMQINFPGAAGSGLFGVNSRGDLSGVWLPDLNGSIEHGFVCPKSAPCFSYDASVSGNDLTQGDGINAHGQVAGVSCDTTVFVCHAFLVAGGTLTSFDFPGAAGTGTLAYGINSAGQIVGRYYDPDGNFHGFLAQPVRTGIPQ